MLVRLSPALKPLPHRLCDGEHRAVHHDAAHDKGFSRCARIRCHAMSIDTVCRKRHQSQVSLPSSRSFPHSRKMSHVSVADR